jgi:hypothetical protein
MKHHILVIVMGFFSFLFGSSSGAQTPGSTQGSADAGRRLRLMMLTTSPEKVGAKPTKDFPRVYGILMDWPHDDETVTVFASSSGTASLYTTFKFGVIGGEFHEPVRRAAIQFTRAADRLFDSAAPTTAYPYPAPDRVRFYLLTFDGVRVIDTDLASLENRTNQYSQVFYLGQAVLTELRLLQEKR